MGETTAANERKRKPGESDVSGSETKNALMELLQAQQSAIEKSGQRWKFLEAMLKVQADAEKRPPGLYGDSVGETKI